MLNWRIYRAAFVPFVVCMFVAAFSLTSLPHGIGGPLAPEAFDGQRAAGELSLLAARYPDRAPASAGDESLADYVAQSLRGSGRAGNGFSVRLQDVAVRTASGERQIRLVIATRPGSTGEAPLLIVAHRDALGAPSVAQLSGTAVLLELSRVFAAREMRRAVILASTSAGSAGSEGAAALPALLGVQPDAAIVLGDLAGTRVRRPVVQSFAAGTASAPELLTATVAGALERQAGLSSATPSVVSQLSHLVFPLVPGEQAPLGAAEIPAVQVQVSGETGPASDQPVSPERLTAVGRGVLESVDALDGYGPLAPPSTTGLVLGTHLLPAWALELLVLTLLLPPFVALADGLARGRRLGARLGRAVVWILGCAIPFLVCALVAWLIGLARLGGLAPPPLPSAAVSADAATIAVIVVVALAFVLGWLAWYALGARFGLPRLASGQAAGLVACSLLVLGALVAALFDPFTALLAIPAAHLWLVFADGEMRPRPPAALAIVLAGLVPLCLIVLFYALHLALSPLALIWNAIALVATGTVTVPGVVLWCLAFGAAAGVALVALAPPEERPLRRRRDAPKITTRGPMSYAGPGSLGGTESALRR
jgi:hypothetical protein